MEIETGNSKMRRVVQVPAGIENSQTDQNYSSVIQKGAPTAFHKPLCLCNSLLKNELIPNN